VALALASCTPAGSRVAPGAAEGAPATSPAVAPPTAGSQTLLKTVQALPVESFGYLPMYVGNQKGFFREEGLELETPIMGSNAALAGLLNGDVDFAVAGSGVRAAMQGAPLKAILYYYNAVLFEFMSRPEIRSVADLRGKNVGTSSRGSTEEVVSNVFLRAGGLDPARDVAYVVVPAGSQLTTLLAESIHAMMLGPDLSATAADQGLHALISAEEIAQAMPRPFSGFVAPQASLQTKPDKVKAWLRASLKSLRFVRENPQESGAIVAGILGLDPNIAVQAAVKTVPAINLGDLGGFTEEGFREEIEGNAAAQGGQPAVSSVEALADLTLLRQVQREMQLPCGTGYQCR
jgi:NitT/TauT family transport system substrate-binding protein